MYSRKPHINGVTIRCGEIEGSTGCIRNVDAVPSYLRGGTSYPDQLQFALVRDKLRRFEPCVRRVITTRRGLDVGIFLFG